MTIRQLAISLLIINTMILIIGMVFALLPPEIRDYLIGKNLIVLEINF